MVGGNDIHGEFFEKRVLQFVPILEIKVGGRLHFNSVVLAKDAKRLVVTVYLLLVVMGLQKIEEAVAFFFGVALDHEDDVDPLEVRHEGEVEA